MPDIPRKPEAHFNARNRGTPVALAEVVFLATISISAVLIVIVISFGIPWIVQ
jgi:hypothetical protein